jgi:hypothetical protein
MPILAAVSFVFVGFFSFVATRPAQFRILRKRAMKVDPSAVFAMINDFHQWERWSPWDKIDPNLARNYSGNASGVGAKYHWAGAKNVGEGTMEILESTPDERVLIDLHFIRPFEARNKTTFTIERGADAVTLSWIMDGENGFMSKLFGLFMNMDKMVGADFEKGLAAMEAAIVSESSSKQGAASAAA